MRKTQAFIPRPLLTPGRKQLMDIGLQQRRNNSDIREENSDHKAWSHQEKLPRETGESTSAEILKKLSWRNLQGCAGSVQPYFKSADGAEAH